MKIKVSEATPLQLNWLMAKCEGYDGHHYGGVVRTTMRGVFGPEYSPTTDWSQGGPIIEREKITIRFWSNKEEPTAYMPLNSEDASPWYHGPTPLIAAMRCYVTSKLGDEIEIPNELQ